VIYDPEFLPVSAELISRTLVYQIPVKMTEERLTEMRGALERAAKA
jgi:8-amino-3,8-dideoxy-alpha-D-manno-octulosonate transaminase